LNPLLDEPEDEEAIALEEAERDKLREEVEDALKNWWTAGENSDRVSKERLEQLWREYDRITDGPALELCETLRLVLAPTKASKMKGGYSAGKRINMRAVIPYIASDFKKDKIWLRRTQPDKRNYQILIAIDDSESMREKRSGQLACEAMLVLCKALERLQVGQVGVVRFGEQAELILPFDRPYNAEAGSAMLSKFTFAQENADFEQLLKFTSEVFAQAGSGPDATSGKALQLLFVIGDGQIRKARDSCRTLIRQAAERSQMCAAIMIDTPDDLSQSIMKVQAPNFDPSGKFVGLTPYLDSFPFNFYTVLQDSELLPDVMGDALRQWYEMTTES
jgi:midasin